MQAITAAPTTEPRPFRLDRSRPAAVQVFETLREDIIGLALPPGTLVVRQALLARFGLSATPVRDALLKLEEEGLVEIFPQHATRVTRIDLGLVGRARFLRLSLELEATSQLAAKPDGAVLARLEALLARQRAAAALRDMESFALADGAFHRAFYEAAGVEELWTVVRRQSGDLDRLRNLHLPVAGKADAILFDHAAILAALTAGDGAAAQEHLRRHLSNTVANVEAIRARHPAFFRD